MTISRRSLGNTGEDIALKYLESKGYCLIERNFQIKGGEIDIIMQKEGIFVFFEVRYRQTEIYGHPLDTMNISKKRTLKRAILIYIAKHKIDPEKVRVDFIGLMPNTSGGHRVWHVRGLEL